LAGYTVTKDNVQNRCGDISARVFSAFAEVRKVKAYLDTKADGDLTTLGVSSSDVADLRSAFADLDQLANIFEGSANLITSKDFRTFAKRLYGVGQY
jgi:hypothetical protein